MMECRIASTFFSKANSGVCTPITTRPCSLYLRAHARTYGTERSQLMHVYVQKLMRTTRPLREAAVNGGELSHPVAPRNDGNLPSMGSFSEAAAICSAPEQATPKRAAAMVMAAAPMKRRRSWLMISDMAHAPRDSPGPTGRLPSHYTDDRESIGRWYRDRGRRGSTACSGSPGAGRVRRAPDSGRPWRLPWW